MRKLLGAVGTAILGASAIIHAQSVQTVPVAGNESSQLWFVELASTPAVEGTAVTTLEREEAEFHATATDAGIRYTERRHFRTLWNGLTVSAAAGDMSKIQALPGVRAVHPVLTVHPMQQEQAPDVAADLITAVRMTGADVAQSELGLTGRGVRVAVIDSGIDFDHPDLGGCFGPGCRVTRGFDFVGDAFNGNNTPVPDPIPDDCSGHGTHVAGIIGANGTLKGVAPDVRFRAYRVFGCAGGTPTDIVLAALERALDDGADVVNMSLGSAYLWPQDPLAQASNRLVRRGIVVVASIGNSGATGLYSAGTPGVGRDVIGVASVDNTHANLNAFIISPDSTAIGYIAASGAPAPPTTGTFPMARTGTATTTNDACVPLPAGSLTGSVVLIRRGTCGFYVKAFNAQTAGAAGVVLYNNTAGFLNATVAPVPPTAPPITIPVVAVTADRGVLINGRLAGGPVTMTWTNQTASEPNPTGGLISGFSSYGLAPDLSFKPDISAPGGSIRSTLPLEQGGFGVLSGTSMSSPHVAGAVALLLQAHPDLRPQEVQERLQNTARPGLWFGNPGLGFLDNVHRQGAGLLRIDDAVLTEAEISPSSLALGEIETGSVRRLLRIRSLERHPHRRHDRRRHDDDRVKYTLSHQPALATGANTFRPEFFDSFATVQFSSRTVTLGSRRHDDDDLVLVTITPPLAADGSRLFGGYIVFTPDDDSPVLRVPYAGYNGDYQAIRVLTPPPPTPTEPTLDENPELASFDPTSPIGFRNQPGGATFTMQGNDVPFILAHLDHQARELKLEVFDVATGRSLNFAADEDFLPRNNIPESFVIFPWDGTTMRRAGGRIRTLPNGTYQIKLSILKALGDRRNPAHVESWTSPNIVIARPAPTTP